MVCSSYRNAELLFWRNQAIIYNAESLLWRVSCSIYRNAELLLCRYADTGAGVWHTRPGTTPTWPASVSSGWPTWWRAAVTPPLFPSHSRTWQMRLLNIRYLSVTVPYRPEPVPISEVLYSTRYGSVSFWAFIIEQKSMKNLDFYCFVTSPYNFLSFFRLMWIYL